MRTTRKALSRPWAVLVAVTVGSFAAVALTVPAVMSGPSATAAPDPCAASQVAKTLGSVATSMGTYLDSHPQTNQALTTISQQQPGPQSVVALKTYFDANPQVGKDMQQLQQPLVGLSGRCNLPLTLPQLMGLMHSAQQGGGLPAGLPAGLPTAPTVGSPPTSAPSPASPAAPVSQGIGIGPGAAIAGLP